jgi:hypothetical protein
LSGRVRTKVPALRHSNASALSCMPRVGALEARHRDPVTLNPNELRGM